MWFSRFAATLLLVFAAVIQINSSPLALNPRAIVTAESDGLQDIVTYDEYSFYVRGERLVFYSGEFHPFRLVSADLYLDVL